MHTYSKEDVKKAINEVCSILGITIDEELLKDYENGKYPDLLMYEKLQRPTLCIPAIHKYLISSQSFLDQPIQYYDIFRACRHINLIQVLSKALKSAISVTGHESKLAILKSATSYEVFESCLFELAVAHRYFVNDQVRAVEFLEESADESPDLEIELDNETLYVECKKYNRSNDLTFVIRNKVREKVRPLLETFYDLREDTVVELSLHTYPQLISPERIVTASINSLRSGCPIIYDDFTVSVRRLPGQEFSDFVLCPSPKYFWERYGFKERGEWFGLVHHMLAQ